MKLGFGSCEWVWVIKETLSQPLPWPAAWLGHWGGSRGVGGNPSPLRLRGHSERTHFPRVSLLFYFSAFPVGLSRWCGQGTPPSSWKLPGSSSGGRARVLSLWALNLSPALPGWMEVGIGVTTEPHVGRGGS